MHFDYYKCKSSKLMRMIGITIIALAYALVVAMVVSYLIGGK